VSSFPMRCAARTRWPSLIAILLLAACGVDTEPARSPLDPAPGIRTDANTRDDGPIFELPFDGSGEDVTGHGHDAELSPYGTSFVEGCQDQALSLDGISGSARIPASGALEPARVTVEVFFRPSVDLTDGVGWMPLMVKMPYGGNVWNTVDGWDLWYGDSGSGGRLGFGLGSQEGRLRVDCSEYMHIAAGEPVHVVGTFDGHRLALYVNGRQVKVTAHHEPIAYLQGPVWIGGEIRHTYFGYQNHFFEGQIDGVALWDRALTSREIRARYVRHHNTTQGHGGRQGAYLPAEE
jgi:hypothetical protein